MVDNLNRGGHYDESVVDQEEADISSTDHEFSQMCRALYVGTTGDVKFVNGAGNTRTLPNMAGGVWHSMYVQKIFKTGTTASDIFGGW